MAIAVFASKAFEVNTDKIYTLNDLQHNSTLQTEKEDIQGSKPSTYIKGLDLDNMSFKIKLDVDFNINPRKEWESWKEIMRAAVPYPFILGNRPYGGCNWLLIAVSHSSVRIDNNGEILSLELDLKFDEYERQGYSKENSKKSSKKKQKEITSLDDNEFGLLIE